MAIIQINAPSRNKKTKALVEGNGRRKFLVTINQVDDQTIVPSFADGVNKAVELWLPLVATQPVLDADGNPTGETTQVNPADRMVEALEKLAKEGKGRRIRIHGKIARLIMNEPVAGENDIVYQSLNVVLDDSVEKTVSIVAPAAWDFSGVDLA